MNGSNVSVKGDDRFRRAVGLIYDYGSYCGGRAMTVSRVLSCRATRASSSVLGCGEGAGLRRTNVRTKNERGVYSNRVGSVGSTWGRRAMGDKRTLYSRDYSYYSYRAPSRTYRGGSIR